MSDVEISQAVFDSLAAKLAALDLTADEYAALRSLLPGVDAAAEVSGFAFSKFGALFDLIPLPDPTQRPPVPIPYPNGNGPTVPIEGK